MTKAPPALTKRDGRGEVVELPMRRRGLRVTMAPISLIRGNPMLHLLQALTNTAHRERDNRGATTAEYGLIIGVVVLAMTLGVDAFQMALDLFFQGLQEDVDNWE